MTIAYAKYYDQAASELISDTTNPITHEREIVRVWPQFNDVAAMLIKEEMDAHIQTYPNGVITQGLTATGLFRVAKRVLVKDAQLANLPQGISETLRHGYATSLDWSEARIYKYSSAHASLIQSVSTDDPHATPPTTGTQIAGAVSNQPSASATVRFYNVSSVAAHSLADTIAGSLVMTASPLLSGNWSVITADVTEVEDGSSVIELFLARDVTIVKTKDKTSLPKETETYTLWNVPKHDAQGIINAWESIGKGRSTDASFGVDSKVMTIKLTRPSSAGDKITKDALVDFPNQCLTKKTVKINLGLTDDEKAALLLAGANRASPGITSDPQVQWDEEIERWDVIITLEEQIPYSTPVYVSSENAFGKVEKQEHIGVRLVPTPENPIAPLTKPAAGVNLNISLEQSKNSNCSSNVGIAKSSSTPVASAVETTSKDAFNEVTSKSHLKIGDEANPVPAVDVQGHGLADGIVRQVVIEKTEFGARLDAKETEDKAVPHITGNGAAGETPILVAETYYTKTLKRVLRNQLPSVSPVVLPPSEVTEGKVIVADVDTNRNNRRDIEEKTIVPKKVTSVSDALTGKGVIIKQTPFVTVRIRKKNNFEISAIPEMTHPNAAVSGDLDSVAHVITEASLETNDNAKRDINEQTETPHYVRLAFNYNTSDGQTTYIWVRNATFATMESDRPKSAEDFKTKNEFNPSINDHGLYDYVLRKTKRNSWEGFSGYSDRTAVFVTMRGRAHHLAIVYINYVTSMSEAWSRMAMGQWTLLKTINGIPCALMDHAGGYSTGVSSSPNGGFAATNCYESVNLIDIGAAGKTVTPE